MNNKFRLNPIGQSSLLYSLALLVIFLFLGRFNICVAQETQGSALFHMGEGAVAVLSQGKVKVPASRFPCANCHGEDGMGRREGATVIPPISWKFLSASTDSRPAYTIDSFQNAVLHGVRVNGQKLGELMPRYETPSQNLVSLIEYLRTLDSEQRKGITASTIHIAPPENEDERLGFIEAITRFNKQGGSYGRTIETEFDDQHFISADEFASGFKEQLKVAIRSHILNSVAEDGISIVALANGPPDSALTHKLALLGIQYDDVAPAMLILDGQSIDQSELSKWIEQSERPNANFNADSTRQLRVYAPASVIGPYLETFSTTQHELILIDLDESAVRWALSRQYSARSAAGFTMGKFLGEAILSSGRDPTRYSIIKSTNDIDFQSELFGWRSGK